MVHMLKSRTGEAIEWLQKAQRANPLLPGPRAWLAAAYALAGDAERAAAELTEARRLGGDDRYSSIAHFKRAVAYGKKTEALAETTFFAALRKAGVPEE
jgi:tetratricopeptide (TPR) repeat protein